MMNNFPNTYAFVQYHGADAYELPWCVQRMTFYNFAGYPTAWTDGLLKREGAYDNVSQNYAMYVADYNTRQAVPTDVTLEVAAAQVSGPTYTVTATVGIEPGGAGKTMRIYIVQVLDYWPTYGGYHRNGFKQAATTQDVTLSPGGSEVVTRQFTFDTESWANQANITLVAWAQVPSSSGPAGVYQAAFSKYPFTPPVPPLGDMDGNFIAEFADVDDFVLALVDLAAYQALHPDLDPVALGDANGDDLLNGLDVQQFMLLIGVDMTPPTPNPMTFAIPPAPTTGNETRYITMTATQAADDHTPADSILYEIDEVTGNPGGTDRTWTVLESYTDLGLNPNTTYGYRVRAKDTSNNIGGWSNVGYAATWCLVPGTPVLSNPTRTTMNVDVTPDADATRDNPVWTEFAIHCKTTTDANWNGKFVSATGAPSTTAVWRTDATWGVTTMTGMQPNTSYQFEVKARNTAGVETVYSVAATLSTTP